MSGTSPSRSNPRDAASPTVRAPSPRQGCYSLKEELFLDALDRLRRGRSDVEMAVALRGLQLLDWSDSTLHLRVPHAFSHSLFEKAVRPHLESELKRMTGAVVRVRLHVGPGVGGESENRPRRGRKNRIAAPGLRDFIRDENNRVACQMLLRYRDGKALFDPFVLHGPMGCGKTHLLRGILDAVPAARPRARVAYMTAGGFGRAYRANRFRRRVEAFRAEMDAPALLVIDELDDLGNLEGTQREIVRLLERRSERGDATVFGSRDLPDRIPGLIPSLATRLQAGMVVGMKPVEPASLVNHLKSRLAKRGIRVERAVLERAVVVARGHPLSAESVVLSALVTAREARRPLTAAAVSEAAPPAAAGGTEPERVARVTERVSAYFGVTAEDLRSPRKVRRALAPRRFLALALRQAFGLTSARIGRWLGGRSISTVTAMLRQARADVATDAALGDMLDQVVKEAGSDDC